MRVGLRFRFRTRLAGACDQESRLGDECWIQTAGQRAQGASEPSAGVAGEWLGWGVRDLSGEPVVVGFVESVVDDAASEIFELRCHGNL